MNASDFLDSKMKYIEINHVYFQSSENAQDKNRLILAREYMELSGNSPQDVFYLLYNSNDVPKAMEAFNIRYKMNVRVKEYDLPDNNLTRELDILNNLEDSDIWPLLSEKEKGVYNKFMSNERLNNREHEILNGICQSALKDPLKSNNIKNIKNNGFTM